MSRRQAAALDALLQLVALAFLLAFLFVACPAHAQGAGQASPGRGGCGSTSNPCKAITFRATRSSGGGVGFCMDGYGGSTSASWGAAAAVGYYGLYVYNGKGCASAAGPVLVYNNSTGLTSVQYGLHAGRGLGASLAFASFPACNGTAITSGGTFGLELFDTTAALWKYCNGASWVPLGAGAGVTQVESWWHGYYSTSDGTGATETTWAAAAPSYAATLSDLTLAVLRAGSGTSSNVSVRVYNATKATVACTCSFACDAVDGTATNCSCGSTAVSAGDALLLQWESLTSCTTPPSINVNVHMLETR